eukprot:gene29322-55313_t
MPAACATPPFGTAAPPQPPAAELSAELSAEGGREGASCAAPAAHGLDARNET